MGRRGCAQSPRLCYHKAHYAAASIAALPGYEVVGDAFFHEFVVRCPAPVDVRLEALLDAGIIPGYDLGRDYPELDRLHAVLRHRDEHARADRRTG